MCDNDGVTAAMILPKWALKPATCACDGEFAGCERCQYLDRREVALQAVADAIADEDAAAEAVAREVWADGFEGDEFRPTLADFLAAQS